MGRRFAEQEIHLATIKVIRCDLSYIYGKFWILYTMNNTLLKNAFVESTISKIWNIYLPLFRMINIFRFCKISMLRWQVTAVMLSLHIQHLLNLTDQSNSFLIKDEIKGVILFIQWIVHNLCNCKRKMIYNMLLYMLHIKEAINMRQ